MYKKTNFWKLLLDDGKYYHKYKFSTIVLIQFYLTSLDYFAYA